MAHPLHFKFLNVCSSRIAREASTESAISIVGMLSDPGQNRPDPGQNRRHLQVSKRVKSNRAAYNNSVWEKVFQRYKQMFGASFRKPEAGGGAYTRTSTYTHTHTRVHTNILIYTHIYNIRIDALTNSLRRTHVWKLKMKRKNNRWSDLHCERGKEWNLDKSFSFLRFYRNSHPIPRIILLMGFGSNTILGFY